MRPPDPRPRIDPIGEPSAPRPFWSIMLPVYEPGTYLEATLRSVLDQDEGPDRMQIAVVDDRSPTVDVAAIVRRLCGDRVEYHRNGTNLRLAGNWNRSIELARGRWVHILHQDDLVLPGFYERLARGAEAEPAAGVLYCQHAVIEPGGRWLSISPLERDEPGILQDWLRLLSQGQRVQCPAVVVRRSSYEQVGGFHPDLGFVLDWEMWVRLAAAFDWWFEPMILACYRVHDQSETNRLRATGRDISDILRGIEIVRRDLPPQFRRYAGIGLRIFGEQTALDQARLAIDGGRLGDGLRLLREARRIGTSRGFSRPFLSNYLRIAKASARRLIHPARAAGGAIPEARAPRDHGQETARRPGS